MTIQTTELREPTSLEKRLLERLMEAEFPGREELSELVKSAMVRTIDENGSLAIDSKSQRVAPVVKRIPVEAEVSDADGVVIHTLLHVVGGRPVELEIFREDGAPVTDIPNPALHDLVVLPPMP